VPPDRSFTATIRPATLDDAGEVFTIQRAAWVDEAQLHDTPFLPPLVQSLDDVRADLHSMTALVAISGHRMVGIVRARSEGPGGDTWYIGRLGVVPDLQGRGLGSRLLRAVEALAPPTTVRFALTTGPKSLDNVAFYERHGYVRVPTDDYLTHLHKTRASEPA
jgi:GNAT superfamily N-acetyltransferase